MPLEASPIEGALLVQWKASAPVGPVVGLVKFTVAVVCPLHNIWLVTGFTIGVGFTVMVNVTGKPGQTPRIGVTVMVAVIGPLVALVVTKGSISPVPLAARPMPVLLLVQLKVEPGVPLKVMVAVVAPLQYTWLATGVTTGVGLTNTVAVIGVPAQPPVVGVMVNVTVIGNGLVLVKVPLILPEPLAAIPLTVAVLLRVQLNTVPGMLPVSTIVVIAVPEQMVWLAGVATAFGVGLTSTVAVIGAPPQPLATGVMVKVTSTGTRVVLVSVPLILPTPLPGIPVTVPVLSLVQL